MEGLDRNCNLQEGDEVQDNNVLVRVEGTVNMMKLVKSVCF